MATVEGHLHGRPTPHVVEGRAVLVWDHLVAIRGHEEGRHRRDPAVTDGLKFVNVGTRALSHRRPNHGEYRLNSEARYADGAALDKVVDEAGKAAKG